MFRPGSAPPWSHCLSASSSSSPPRGARTVLPAWGPLPRCSSHHAPPLPIRGRGPRLSLPQRAAGGVLCSRMPSWGQQWRAMRRGARPRGAAAGRNSHVAKPLPRCLPQGLQGAWAGASRQEGGRAGRTHLEHLRLVDQPHEREEASVGPAVDGHPAQVDEAILLGHELQALHLVLNLHLALGDEAGNLSVAPPTAVPPLPLVGSPLPLGSKLHSHSPCSLGQWSDRPGTNPALLPPGCYFEKVTSSLWASVFPPQNEGVNLNRTHFTLDMRVT